MRVDSDSFAVTGLDPIDVQLSLQTVARSTTGSER